MNRIQTKKASAFQFKFGEPLEQGVLVYETAYDLKGNILDSIVYSSNKISLHEKYTYNENNELIMRVLLDRFLNFLVILISFLCFIKDKYFFHTDGNHVFVNDRKNLVDCHC